MDGPFHWLSAVFACLRAPCTGWSLTDVRHRDSESAYWHPGVPCVHPAPGAEIVCILAPFSRGTCGFDMATASSTLCGKPGKRGLQWQGNVLSEFYKMLNDRERWADLSDPRHNDDQTTSSPEEVVRISGWQARGKETASSTRKIGRRHHEHCEHSRNEVHGNGSVKGCGGR